MNKEKENYQTIKSIEGHWYLKGDNYWGLFNGSNTELNTEYEFCTFDKLFSESSNVRGYSSHEAPQGIRGFKIVLNHDNSCNLVWTMGVPHPVIGTATKKISMDGKWEENENMLSISYEYNKTGILFIGEYKLKKLTHTVKMLFRLDNGSLFITPIEVVQIDS